MNHVVIVDFSHLFHIARFVAETHRTEQDIHEATIETFIGKLRKMKRQLGWLGIRGYDLVFAEDQPAVWKSELLPGYRSGHKDLSAEKQIVKQHLVDNGSISRFCHSLGQEADDTIATLTSMILDADCDALICSGDRDLWQLIQPGVQVYNPIAHTIITEADIQKSLVKWKRLGNVRLDAVHIPLLKTLWGDAGDCVPNLLPRTQKHFLPVMVNTKGTLEEFREVIETESKFYLPPKCYRAFVDAGPELDRNYQLVKLRTDCELVWE